MEYKIKDNILYGYILSTLENISYTLKYLDLPPVINASNKTIIINSTFNPLDDVSGIDNEDKDITKNIKIIKNTVDTKKIGNYEVIYGLTDSYGNYVTKEIIVNVVDLVSKDALFMFDGLKHEKDNLFTFSGFIGVKGMDNKNTKKELIFVNQQSNKEYVYELSKWNDYPYEMSSLDDNKEYDYSDGWFKETIDLTELLNGDYTIYVKCVNGNNEAKTLFTNIAYVDMTRRAKGNNKEFLIEVDYSSLNSPLLFSVRDKLISIDIPKTIDPMYNFINEINLKDNMLTIKGTSHNFGVSYKESDNVERKLILENQESFERISLDLGSITNGDYPITLAVSDNLDKTRAWYNKTIDLSSVPSGKYTLYILNTVNDTSYYGEIIDVAYTDFSKINNDIYNFSRNDNLRLRVELEVKK